MSKITFTTKYLTKQHLIMGLIATICVILFLAFQFTNVENQSTRNVDIITQESDVDLMNSINWKEVDLHKYSIPVDIGENGFSTTIADNRKTIKVIVSIICICNL